MDVLNTYGGGPEWALVGLGGMIIGVGAYGLFFTVIVLREREYGFGALLGALSLFGMIIGGCFTFAEAPIRHEVTLHQGHVIDAVKYEVIEQRGEIYVIEEREVGE